MPSHTAMSVTKSLQHSIHRSQKQQSVERIVCHSLRRLHAVRICASLLNSRSAAAELGRVALLLQKKYSADKQ